ncbi:MAG: hypothetical protein QM770_03180 [Tepidisphaeraceae bacterium]
MHGPEVMRIANAYEAAIRSPMIPVFVVRGLLRRCTEESRIEAAEVNEVQHGGPMFDAEEVEVEQLVDRPAV